MSGTIQRTRLTPRRGRLPRRLLVTATTGGALCGLYVAYTVVFGLLVHAPSLAPGSADPVLRRMVPAPSIQSDLAKQYLPLEPWAANSPYFFRTESNTYVFFEDWHHVDSKEAVRFHPFAMIVMPDEKDKGEPPITVVSQSAYVRFARPFDVTRPDPGRVVFASLDGGARIAGPDGMRLEGKNFTYSEVAANKEVYTDSEIRFAYGPHRGTALGMEVDLILDEEARRQEQVKVLGYNGVWLRRNVVMDLEFEDRDPRAPAATEEAEPPAPQMVHVQSDGTFHFDVNTHIATFETNVQVTRPTLPGQHDSLACDLLTLFFEAAPQSAPEAGAVPPPMDPLVRAEPPVPEPAGGPAAADEEFRGLGDDLEFRRLQADGRQVVLVSQVNGLRAEMQQLTYDRQTKIATLTATNGLVRVVQDASEMHSPRITLTHDDDGEITTALCQGAGWLKRVNRETDALELAAQWQKQLKMYPDARTDDDVIELVGQAVVQQPETPMSLQAGSISIWAERQENAADTAPPAAGSPGDSEGYRPKRLLARTDVVMASPEMNARTKRLEVWFEPIPGMPDVVPAADAGRRPRGDLRPVIQQVAYEIAAATSAAGPQRSEPRAEPSKVEGRGAKIVPADRSAARDPQPSILAEAASPADAPPSPPEPIHVAADLIQVRVLHNGRGQDAQVSQVWTNGNVHVEQIHLNGEPPLVIDATRLHMKSRGETGHVLDVYGHSAGEATGAPAHIRDRGMHIEGYKIHLDRARNKAWVEGEGLLQLPMEEGLDGKKLTTPQPLDIWWSEKMDFDGKTAQFYGQVRAVLDRSTLRCAEMTVHLSDRISFAEDVERAGRDRAEVHTVHCRDGVSFDSDEYEGGQIQNVHRGEFIELKIERQTGRMEAQGPGILTTWRRGNANRAAVAPAAGVRANAGLQPQSSPWEFMQITFSGRADGNFGTGDDKAAQRTTTFYGRGDGNSSGEVKVVYGPVERPLAKFTIEELPRDAGWIECETLHVTQHLATDAAGRAWVDLVADGDARLEGNNEDRWFNGMADKITYDESKGVYWLRSLAPNLCQIWHQKQPGAPSDGAKAQTMMFIPSRQILRLFQTAGVSGSQ